MNSFLLKDFLEEVGSALEDRTFVRWTINDLIDATTHTLRRMVVIRPDAFARRMPLVLAEGPAQELPPEVHRLMDMQHNMVGQLSAIRPMPMAVVDNLVPNWRSGPRKNKIVHWHQDQKESRTFDVYPPAAAGTVVMCLVSRDHPPFAHIASNDLADVPATDVVTLTTLLRPALLYGVLAHAWGRDGEYQNGSLATQMEQMFKAELSNEFQAGVAARSTTDKPE